MLSATLAHAQPVGREQARQRAETFMATHRPDIVFHTAEAAAAPRRHTPATMTPGTTTASNAPQPYYIFNVGTDAGYVIVGGDDRARTILGYTDSGHFDAATTPPAMLAWLDDCAVQIASLTDADTNDANVATAAAPHPTLGATPTQWAGGLPVRPMLSTQWNQDAPYNQMCPIYTDGGRCVAGCVAVAMAQVMRHHRWPVAPLPTAIPGGYVTYSPFVAGTTVPAGTTFNWGLMRDSYAATTTSTDGSQQAVAQLIAACGVAAETGYASWGSGSALALVENALTRYFDYSTTTTHVERRHHTSDSWHALIYNELASGRPVLYGGMSTEQGHVFVLDGYDGGGLFHINWGWGGLSDGFYALTALNPDYATGIGASPTADGYNSDQHAIVGVWPNDAARPYTDAATAATPQATLVLDSYDLPRGAVVTEREVELVCHVRNASATTFAGQVYLLENSQVLFATDYDPMQGGITIAPGATRDVAFRFLPYAAGTRQFTLCHDVSRPGGRFADITIEVAQNQSAPLADVVFQSVVYKYNMGDNHIHGTKIKGYFVVKNFNTTLDYDGDVTMVWYAYHPEGEYFQSFLAQDYHIHVPAGEECQFPFEVPNLEQNIYMPYLRVNGVNQTNGWDDICYLDGLPNDITATDAAPPAATTPAYDLLGRRVAPSPGGRPCRPGIYVVGGRKVAVPPTK